MVITVEKRSKNDFNGVKVFSATMARTRDSLSERVTKWTRDHPECELVNTIVTQSSDDAFHCLTFSIFYWEPLD